MGEKKFTSGDPRYSNVIARIGLSDKPQRICPCVLHPALQVLRRSAVLRLPSKFLTRVTRNSVNPDLWSAWTPSLGETGIGRCGEMAGSKKVMAKIFCALGMQEAVRIDAMQSVYLPVQVEVTYPWTVGTG